MHRPLLVTAKLSGPLAGDPPRLDALLEYVLSLHHKKGQPGYKIDRKYPAPAQGEISITLRREWLGDWLVPRCSDPILPVPANETVEHVNKRIGVENAGLLTPESRVIVSTTNSWTKSYRIPLRLRTIPMIRWFAFGDHRETFRILRRVNYVGKKVADGYGRVSEWSVDAVDNDLSWFAQTEHGPLLMRTLPIGDWLPPGLIGSRIGFGAVVSPYWHPSRYADAVYTC